jgi:hypothetical protein
VHYNDSDSGIAKVAGVYHLVLADFYGFNTINLRKRPQGYFLGNVRNVNRGGGYVLDV